MKIKIVITLLIISTSVAFSENYMDDIALKACDCLNSVPDTLDTDRFNIELGLCMINAATPYQKQLKKDYKIDFNKMDTQGEEFGRIIGLRMVSFCPNSLLKLVNQVSTKQYKTIPENMIEGWVTAINDEKFVEFSIKDEFGKITKYHWLTFIESSSNLLTDYKTLTNKFVQITFTPKEFFDARIGEYRTFNIIEKLEIINPIGTDLPTVNQ